MNLPEGASVSIEELKRVADALDVLSKDPHASRELDIHVTLHVHNEYPKHIVVGKDKEGEPITRIVASAEEEKAALTPKARVLRGE